MATKNDILEKLWRGKHERRRSLARLPIEEKLQILIDLQRLAYPILARRHKNQLKPWK